MKGMDFLTHTQWEVAREVTKFSLGFYQMFSMGNFCTLCLLDKLWKRVSLCKYFDKIF